MRKGISPVLATVILIAITLIAAVAIASFFFNLLGTFQNQALLSVKTASCSETQCTVVVHNGGTLAGSILNASAGFDLASPVSVQANSDAIIVLEVALNHGDAVSGYLVQGNGPNLAFIATVA